MKLMATERLGPVADFEARVGRRAEARVAAARAVGGAGVAAGPPSRRGARYGGRGRTDVARERAHVYRRDFVI